MHRIGAVIFMLVVWPWTFALADDAAPPNIILILADDLGWRDVGYAGTEFFETPNIDRLASQGMTFTAAYSGGPNCSPTRACLMSGTYTPRHHIYTPGGMAKGDPRYMRLLVPANQRKNDDLAQQAAALFPITNSLDPHFVCIPEVLKPRGYTTARLGKWHLGDDTQGFDLSSANGRGGPGGSFYGKPAVTEQLTERALSFISDNRDGPFFLYLPYWFVHSPHHAREDIVSKYRHKLELLPESERRRFNPVYAAMIEAVDTGVGQIMQRVDDLGIAENTLVIFTSDNGGTGVAMLPPLRGMKGSLFEAGVRVPACMRWTGRIEPGTFCDTPITSVDFLPTFASLAGADLPDSQPVDGVDFSPLLKGEPIDERAIFWHYPLYLQGVGLTIDLPNGKTYTWRGFPSTAMRRGPWKLVEFHEDDTIGLYNLTDDPGETTNLAAARPDVAARLRAELDAWQERTHAPIPTVPNPECVLGPPPTGPSAHDIGPFAAMGLMVGEVTPTSALVQVRLTGVDHPYEGDVPGTAGLVEFVLTPETAQAAEHPDIVQRVEASAEHDYIARAAFNDLLPGVSYSCRTNIGGSADSLQPGPAGRFHTLPGPDTSAEVTFVAVTGMNYAKFHGDNRIDRAQHLIQNNTELPPPYDGPDKYLGYPALASILALKPDFFVGTGDNVYYDTPTKPRAANIPELRRKWHEQFVQPRFVDLFAAVPTYWEIDDHDFRVDDSDNAGAYDPTPAVGRQMMLEQLPVAPQDDADARTYRTHRISRDLQVWFTEGRMYRSPNASPDDAHKSIWGEEQRAWLERTLTESDATFKLLISPTPMIGPDDRRKIDNHTDVGGFQHERDEFFQWLVDSGVAERGFAIICGDRHWQYDSIHPSGIEEFSCGALVDANSRPGRRPGDPNSTDPDALIRQPYSQDTPSGGFLLVHITPAHENQRAAMTVEWHDEHGELLHKLLR